MDETVSHSSDDGSYLFCRTSSPSRSKDQRKSNTKQDRRCFRGFWPGMTLQKDKRPGVVIVLVGTQSARETKPRAPQADTSDLRSICLAKQTRQTPSGCGSFVAEAMISSAGQGSLCRRADTRPAPTVDPSKVAAIGYCLAAASCSIWLARARRRNLPRWTWIESRSQPAKPRILVMIGAEDPMIPPEEVAKFRKEMTDAGARFEVISYPGAKHSFTNPTQTRLEWRVLPYNAAVDKESCRRCSRCSARSLRRLRPSNRRQHTRRRARDKGLALRRRGWRILFGHAARSGDSPA